MNIDRRTFVGSAMMAAVGCAVGGGRTGARFGGWKKGHFQIHFTYTGASESVFLIFPDGTTLLLDCGDFDAASRAVQPSRAMIACAFSTTTIASSTSDPMTRMSPNIVSTLSV